MTKAEADHELIGRVVAGDRRAFDEIMRSHEDRVFSVCMRIMSDRERALDATQDTFLTVFRKASQFKGDSALGTWIYRIAVNTCFDQIRKTRRQHADPMPEYFDPSDPSAEDAVDSAALRHDIKNALDTLPVEFRAAIVLCDIEGMPIPEAARVLGVPSGTVKSRLFRGRRLMAKHLGNQEGT